MNILVIGGSRFLGRFVVEEALHKGYQVTVFNRGQHNAIFEGQPVEQLIGDRKRDLSLLHNRSWDAVVDTCAYLPGDVTGLLDALQGNMKHYTFISSISVYQDWVPPGINESYTTPTLSEEKLQELLNDPSVTLPGQYYGHLKRMCEMEAERLMPGQVLNVRPGLIVGPHDESDRLTYWVRRVGEGGEVLAPEFPDQQIQFIDGRDLASWILHGVEQQVTGIYNATGPAKPLSMEQFLNTCRSVTSSDAEWVWAKEQFLLDHGVQPWMDLPLWIPYNFPLEEGGEPWRGAGSVNITPALEAGLTLRPLEATLADLWHWDQQRSREGKPLKAGLTSDREKELILLYREE